MRFTKRLSGKTAVVTGASGGIGRQIALLLADCGVHLHLSATKRNRLQKTEEAAQGRGVSVHTHTLDFRDVGEVDRFHRDVCDVSGSVDILVNNAGAYGRARIEDDRSGILSDLLRVNVEGAYALTRAFLPELSASRGDIVFINSSVVRRPAAGVAQYASTRHALRAIADALRAELNAKGVRVLSVFPGRTATPGQEEIFRTEQRAYVPSKLLQPIDVATVIVASIGLPETAEVTDIHIRPKAPP